jgi:hypothetical protein
MDISPDGSGEGVSDDTVFTTVHEAREFLAVQPLITDSPTVHWLDQGSSRLARRASIADLQQMWVDARDDAVHRGTLVINRVDEEASRLFRLAIAIAIVAKDDARSRVM